MQHRAKQFDQDGDGNVNIGDGDDEMVIILKYTNLQ
jgi:hypothetical protein